MKRLHVNIDHCATLRQARHTTYPDPIWCAAMAEMAGAHGITVHLREDRRHIQDRDVKILRQTVRSILNLEMAAVPSMIEIAAEIKPDIVTLVPEKRTEITTEGGLDVSNKSLKGAMEKLRKAKLKVSLFIDAKEDVIQKSADLGASIVEFHTGDYCNARGDEREILLQRLAHCATKAASLGLRVAAGHGLDYPNVRPVAAIPEIEELNIGHAIMARALFVGIDRAVRDMICLMND